MKIFESSRRKFILAWSALIGSALASSSRVSAATLQQTAKATEGPFYPEKSMRLEDIDNDLVKVMGAVKQAGGEVIKLKGQVKDTNGKPLEGLRVEIWQCDVNGRYLHTGDKQAIDYDQGFQGFGHDITNTDGQYSFRSIKPTKYPGRTPHIHVKVCKGEKELLTSQFYIADEPDNAGDSIFRRLSKQEADAVSMKFVGVDDGFEAKVDIVV
ncbi:MAG: intradiol ring-cleavage dioxygenase [Granulosicoccus sp.]